MQIQINRELRLESITRESLETLYPFRFRQRGIGLACMKVMLQYLRELGIKEVLFDVDEENSVSIRLLQKIPEMRLKSKEKRLLYSCPLQEGFHR